MLVLSRKVNEAIKIGTDVEVKIIDVHGDVVRLGINAPQQTQIWRKELWDVIVQENRHAAEVTRATKAGATVAPQLPVSTFSRLSKIRTVSLKQPKVQDE